MIEIFGDDIPDRLINSNYDDFYLGTTRLRIFFSKKEEENWWFNENRVIIINNFVQNNSSFDRFRDWSIFFFYDMPRMTLAEVQRNKKRLGLLNSIYGFVHLFEQYINLKFKKYSFKANPFEEIIL